MTSRRRRSLLQKGSLLALAACLAPLGRVRGGAGERPTVLIVGAGAAGMTAAYLLAREGIEFKVLEAAPVHGGRMKRLNGFADFPVPLGAEWLHGPESLLDGLAGGLARTPGLRTLAYGRDARVGRFAGGTLRLEAIGRVEDRKFIGSTWFDLFDSAIAPVIKDRLRPDTVVTEVDHSGPGVHVTTSDGEVIQADKALITVPTQVLKDGDIRFIPDLPAEKRSAIERAEVWGGIKVFILFSERFYPAFLEFSDSDSRSGQRLYYDAAYGQDSAYHVMGLFAVGEQARRYQDLSATDLKARVLGELDAVFAGRASRAYINHVTQNWDEEPHIRSAYLSDHADWRIPPRLARPVGKRLYFAGEACTEGEDWGGVHDAARSARQAVERLLGR
ncbi:MAG: flavin monoamine oxidase family protein [Gammaproteobacteria bacterium]